MAIEASRVLQKVVQKDRHLIFLDGPILLHCFAQEWLLYDLALLEKSVSVRQERQHVRPPDAADGLQL